MISFKSLSPVSFPPDHIVAFDEERSYSWEDFCNLVGSAAAALTSSQRVAITASNSFHFLAWLIAATSKTDHVIIPPNDLPQTLRELDHSIDCILGDDVALKAPVQSWSLEGRPLQIDFYTSGSSGPAKRIRRSLHEMECEVGTLDSMWRERVTHAITYSTIPHQHVYGIIFRLIWPLLSGRPFIIRRFDFWEDLIRALKPGAMIVTSPTHLNRMGGLQPLPPSLTPALILTGGAPLSDEAASTAAAILNRPVDELYGSTETGAIATRKRSIPDPPWTPFPGYALSRSENGLLLMTAPAAIIGDGMELQDRVEFDHEGRFRLKGRADRVAKIEGKRVDLGEVESRLLSCSECKDAIALVLEGGSPTLAAVVALTAQAQEQLARMGHFQFTRELRGKLAQFMEPSVIPKQWRFVDELPVNSVGKKASEARKLFEVHGHG